MIALDNRLGLAAGDVVRLGTAPDDEYLTIASLPGATGVAPDAGNLVLAQALVGDHAAGDEVRRQTPPAAAGLQSCVLALNAEQGADTLAVSDGDSYPLDGFIRITTPTVA